MSYLGDFLFAPARANSPVQIALRRRAQPPAAGAPVRPAGQRAGARRADQRPRHRHARAARGAAAGLRRHGVPGQPRPRASSTTWSPAPSSPKGDGPLARIRGRRRGLAAPVRARGASAPHAPAAPRRGRTAAAARRPPPGRGASSATRSSASSTSCRRASRRSKPSRATSPSCSRAARSTPTRRSASARCSRATTRSSTS